MQHDTNLVIGLVAVVALLIIVASTYWAWSKCHLGELSKKGCPGNPHSAGGFVGAMGNEPHLVPCAFPLGNGWHHNRCNYA